MRHYGRISLIVLLAVLGDGAAAYAQGSGHFDRVTTTAQTDARSSIEGNRVARREGPQPLPRTVARADSLRPYSSQSVGPSTGFGSQTPLSSSWEQEPQRPAAEPQAAAPSRPSHLLSRDAAWSGRPAAGQTHRSRRLDSANRAALRAAVTFWLAPAITDELQSRGIDDLAGLPRRRQAYPLPVLLACGKEPLVFRPVMKRNSEIQKIAFVGDYLPRKCGIATFTYDLCTSVATQYPGSDCFVVPVNDVPQGYDYPAEVRFEIEEQEVDSYLRAADFLNFANTDVVCLQHEFGIFGGPAGSHILRLLRDLRMPVVTTLHTVLREPTAEQRRVLGQIADLSARLVVMSERAPDVSPGGLRRPGRQDRPDRPRHPRHAVRRPQLLQGPVRRRGQVRRADVRAALAEQGHRADAAGDAGDPRASFPTSSTSSWGRRIRT